MNGPEVLAGLVDEERLLKGDPDSPETILAVHTEREWGAWTGAFKTVHQDRNFNFIPLREVTDEKYTLYFPAAQE